MYNYREDIDFSKLDTHTPDGIPYKNDTLSGWVENGHYVMIYLCEKELEEEWNKRSQLDYSGKDKLGQKLKYTLIRYLTSKGLRKDAGGIKQLDENDIKAIENGVANYIFLRKYSLYPRVYQVYWEIDNYRHGSNPSGHSVAQRIAYKNAAEFIIRNNLFFGVGTGDVQDEFDDYYSNIDKQIKPEYRRRAHNQYLTFIVTFGLVGFLLSIIGMFLPVFLSKNWKNYLFISFALIGFISMLNEDTLETQTGVSFFTFFYSILLFGRNVVIERPPANQDDDPS
jgi:hypothetical protein